MISYAFSLSCPSTYSFAFMHEILLFPTHTHTHTHSLSLPALIALTRASRRLSWRLNLRLTPSSLASLSLLPSLPQPQQLFSHTQTHIHSHTHTRMHACTYTCTYTHSRMHGSHTHTHTHATGAGQGNGCPDARRVSERRKVQQKQ